MSASGGTKWTWIDPVIALRGPGDTVAKVENRTTPKILRKLIFRLLYRCNALPTT